MTSADVISFFQDVLHANGWTIISDEPVGSTAGAASGIQVLATHGSEDGYYWELGVEVSSSTFSAGSAPSVQPGGVTPSAPGSSGQSTPFSVRLFEISDAN